MRSPTRANETAAPVVAESDVEQSVSDETTERLLKGVLIAISAVIVLGLFAGAAIWALQGDEEPPTPMNAVDVGFLQDMLDHWRTESD